ncbi:Arm DNA-binding domain-containing protein [Massilia sp. 9096]|uniref:Arm DNA-binding domain-containing protein n=1 Tax=Massilia sp. 9096 TaxID=1500894 RepID=UPI000561E0E4
MQYGRLCLRGQELAGTVEKPSALACGGRLSPYYSDGGGLCLQVSKAGTKSWIFQYTLSKKPREMGHGPPHTRTAAKLAVTLERAKTVTFDHCA